MEFSRSAGILLHPTSLPGNYGIGDLGAEAYKFIDFLNDAGQSLWQVFPLGPTGFGDSPYQCFSAFAGNPLLISPDKLIEMGLLSKADVLGAPNNDSHKIDFGPLINYKSALLKRAFENYKSNSASIKNSVLNFFNKQKDWLDDYSLFMACKEYHNGVQWTNWSDDIAFRREGAVEMWKAKLTDKIEFQIFIQYLFFDQWNKLKNYANSKGIKVIGDLPIFIAYDSADLWANKILFSVDKHGKLKTVAGVPPDYFSPTGQLWGNPLYKWDEMQKNDFKWWRKRIAQLFTLFDIVRIDHFRGLDAFYEIPGDAETAVNGRWVNAPGDELFTVIEKEFGEVPIIAEDLGVITDSVIALRDKFKFPGMKILQFSFGKDGDKKFLPHNHVKNCVVYPGSHDNDTTRGFFENAKINTPEIFEWTKKYLGCNGTAIHREVIRAAYASVADMVIIPMQDVLDLGSEARMNFPGRLGGNWTWRFTWEQVKPEVSAEYLEMAEIYERV